MERRKFLATSLAAACATLTSRPGLAAGRDGPLRLTVHPDQLGNGIAADFTGLSYETSQLSDPTFFAPANTSLAAFHRRLGAAGVLRIGGNTSEFGIWSPSAAAGHEGAPSQANPGAFGPDTGRHPPPRRRITPLAVRNLHGFLQLSGWRLIYGLNMGLETPETVAEEAAYVARVMGGKLIAFQLCNEPDLFHRNGLRSADYGYRQFAEQWRRYFLAVRRRVPGARLVGPDTAHNSQWLLRFAHDQRNDVAFLSQHYYAEGPPSDPAMTLARLLGPSPGLEAEIEAAATARRETGLRFRMTETNSCYGGGKPGVSDTFAAALWGGDLMYRLAQAGALGINFHGGGYGWYTPVAGTRENGFVARPIYYGMLLFAAAGTGRLVRTEIDGGSDGSLTAYGLVSAEGELKVILFNRNLADDASLQIRAPGRARASLLRLIAPRADDRTDVTLGGAAVGGDGLWAPAVTEGVGARNGLLSVSVPRASAALVTLSA